MKNPEIVNRTLVACCYACLKKRLHDEDDWKMHPYAGHGFVKEHGWTHTDLALAADTKALK